MYKFTTPQISLRCSNRYQIITQYSFVEAHMSHCADAMGSLKGLYLPHGDQRDDDAYHNRLCESTENLCGVSHLLYNYYSLFIVFYCAIQLFLYLTMLVFTVTFCVSPISLVYRLFVSGKQGSPPKTRQPHLFQDVIKQQMARLVVSFSFELKLLLRTDLKWLGSKLRFCSSGQPLQAASPYQQR